jgi:hypothetical protein
MAAGRLERGGKIFDLLVETAKAAAAIVNGGSRF